MNDEYRDMLLSYVSELESYGNIVHLPHRDTDQNKKGLEICIQNKNAIIESDEVHVFYSSLSQGTHFDLGVSFALNKRIKIILNEEYSEGKSFAKMIKEWENENMSY